jgi:hypothetical protein
MESLLFLCAIIAICVIMVRFIVEDSRQAKRAAPTANALRTPMLQKDSNPPQNTPNNAWRR